MDAAAQAGGSKRNCVVHMHGWGYTRLVSAFCNDLRYRRIGHTSTHGIITAVTCLDMHWLAAAGVLSCCLCMLCGCCVQAVIQKGSFLKDVCFYLASLIIIAFMLADGQVGQQLPQSVSS